MPTVMAQAVIRMGRSRSWAPARAASGTTLRSCHSMAMKVTSITEFDTDTPMHMIDPMNDSMLSVVPVTQQHDHHAAEDAGHTRHRGQGQPRRLEVGGQEHQDHHHREARPIARARNISFMGATWPRIATRTPRGGSPAAAMACSICRAARPRSSPSTLAVMLT